MIRPAFSTLLQPQTRVSRLSSHHGAFIGDNYHGLLTTPSIAIADNNEILVSPSASALDIFLRPDTVLPPINAASEAWVRSLVWFDFKVAVAFFVVAPLILLSWAVVARIPPNNKNGNESIDKLEKTKTTVSSQSSPPIAETVLRYMTSYWQASSLLLLTLTLDIQENTICVVVGLLAQAMIVASLWWWEDLNEELALEEEPGSNNNDSIGTAFVLWRNVATLAASTGVIIQVPFQSCVIENSLVDSPYCAPWLEPPTFAAGQIGIAASPALEILTLSGLALYTIVLAYYVLVLVPSVGRLGRAARPEIMNVVSPVGAWQMMGFLEDQNTEPSK